MTSPQKFPDEILRAWEKAVVQASPRCRGFQEALKSQRENLQFLWKAYTKERTDLGRLRLTDARLVAPYLLGFHLSNWAKTAGVFQRSFAKDLTIPKGTGPIRIIDLGCGTGAAAQAAWWALHHHEKNLPLQIELVDRSRHLVQSGQNQILELAPKADVRTLAKALDHPIAKKVHDQWIQQSGLRLNVILLSYVWNELRKNPRGQQYLGSQLRRWSSSAVPAWLCVVEPATEVSARGAMELRDHLVQSGWQAIYPCPTSHRCPMGSRGRDWCYSEFSFEKSNSMSQVDKILGVSRNIMGAAGYLFVNPAAISKMAPLKVRPVVVGHPTGASASTLICDGQRIDRAKPSEGLRGSFT